MSEVRASSPVVLVHTHIYIYYLRQPLHASSTLPCPATTSTSCTMNELSNCFARLANVEGLCTSQPRPGFPSAGFSFAGFTPSSIDNLTWRLDAITRWQGQQPRPLAKPCLNDLTWQLDASFRRMPGTPLDEPKASLVRAQEYSVDDVERTLRLFNADQNPRMDASEKTDLCTRVQMVCFAAGRRGFKLSWFPSTDSDIMTLACTLQQPPHIAPQPPLFPGGRGRTQTRCCSCHRGGQDRANEGHHTIISRVARKPWAWLRRFRLWSRRSQSLRDDSSTIVD